MRTRLRSPNHTRGLVAAGLWGCRSLAVLWAAGWTAFVAFSAAPEVRAEADLLLPVAVFGLGVLVPVALAWFWPRFGGLVLVGLGAVAWGMAGSEASRVGVVIPALGTGVAFLVAGSAAAWQRRRTLRRAIRLARQMERSPAEA